MLLKENDLNNINDKVSKKQFDEAWLLFMRQVNGELWFNIRNRNIFQVKEKVYPRVCNQISNQVWWRVGDQIWNSVDEQVEHQINKSYDT